MKWATFWLMIQMCVLVKQPEVILRSMCSAHMERFSPVTLISSGLGESAIQTENDPQSQRVHSKFENRQILEFRGGLSGNLVLLKTASAHWKRIKSTKWARCRPDKCVLNVDTASWSDYRSHIKTLPSCCCYALRYTGRNIYWKWQWMKADNINHWV